MSCCGRVCCIHGIYIRIWVYDGPLFCSYGTVYPILAKLHFFYFYICTTRTLDWTGLDWTAVEKETAGVVLLRVRLRRPPIIVLSVRRPHATQIKWAALHCPRGPPWRRSRRRCPPPPTPAFLVLTSAPAPPQVPRLLSLASSLVYYSLCSNRCCSQPDQNKHGIRIFAFQELRAESLQNPCFSDCSLINY